MRIGAKHSLITKTKMSEAQKGEKHHRYWLGKKRSKEHLAKMILGIKKVAKGKPFCEKGCGKRTSNYDKKMCRKCHDEVCRGVNHPLWKGGYENKLMHSRKRRVSKLKAEGSHTLDQWDELKRRFGYMCLCCKKVEPDIKLTEDHIIPLVKGGSDNIENIQPLCRSCNSRKQVDLTDYRFNFEITCPLKNENL